MRVLDDRVILLKITVADRDYVLKHASPSPELRENMRFGLIKDGVLVCRLTPDDAAELVDCFFTLSETAPGANQRKHFGGLVARSLRILEENLRRDGLVEEEGEGDIEEGAEVEPGSVGHPWRDEVVERTGRARRERRLPAREELAAAAQAPIDELAGLSRMQFFALMSTSIDGPEGIIRINADLEPHEVSNAVFAENARRMLRLIDSRERVKATTSKNLNRAFVAELIDALAYREGYIEDLRKFCKVINEFEVRPAHIVRVVLELAGLIRLQRGHFSVTKKGQRLMADTAAVELYLLLFRTFFSKFSLAYLDRCAVEDDVQDGVNYSLYAIHKGLNDWVDKDDVPRRVLLPMLYDTLVAADRLFLAELVTVTRIVNPLEGFGLLEFEYVPDWGDREKIGRVRKTPLFDRLIRFSFAEIGTGD